MLYRKLPFLISLLLCLGTFVIGQRRDGDGSGDSRNNGGHINMPLDLGFLSFLPGTWKGEGFTLTAVPNGDNRPPSTGPSAFRNIFSNTKETTSFWAIDGGVPNRGGIASFSNLTAQPDIIAFGLQYEQNIVQTNTPNGVPPVGIHTETGQFLNVPASTVFPNQAAFIERGGCLPHSVCFRTEGLVNDSYPISGGPDIPDIDSFPTSATTGAPITNTNYLLPYTNPLNLPPGITTEIIKNPNLLLCQAIANQTIIETISFTLTGSALTSEFIRQNARVGNVRVTYWIETVQRTDGSTFLQLQSSQVVELIFLNIVWPHVSVSSLVKQEEPSPRPPPRNHIRNPRRHNNNGN